MANLLDKLPTILILSALVGIFVSLRRHAPNTRTRLWTAAWMFIFLHFFVQALETRTGALEKAIEAADLAALELSGVVFIVSLGLEVERKYRRWASFLSLGFAAVFHSWGASFEWKHDYLMALALGVFFGSLLISALRCHSGLLFKSVISTSFLATGIWAFHRQWHGQADPGVNAILTTGFALPGILYFRRYPRFSPGVISVVCGFIAWGAVFPVGTLFDLYAPNLKLNPEIWNVPKFIVAFGMILTLLEDKTRQIEERNVREHAENILLGRFSRVTSQLLTEKDPLSLWPGIAQAIHDAINFRRVAILIARENGSAFVAGTQGYSAEKEELLREKTSRTKLATFQAMRLAGIPVCGKTVRVRFCADACNGDDASSASAPDESAAGMELITPLQSRQGQDLGWILLSDPACADDFLQQQIVRLELLASDFAAQVENTRLQRQLVRAEKLAGIGQLVAGVAHELNNPLTGIIGYSDILSEELKHESAVRRLTKLGEEARRMKRIIDSLLRFSRMDNANSRSSDLSAAVQDALQLREYFIRSRGIDVRVAISPGTPRLAISSDELKQVLLNLLSNAIDAVENAAERRIEISATQNEDQVVLRFEDSGAGFCDLHRALDPFYTTKPVGKGTGLGLSICYGLVKNCGGEIHVSNLETGASITLSLPIDGEPCSQSSVSPN